MVLTVHMADMVVTVPTVKNKFREEVWKEGVSTT